MRIRTLIGAFSLLLAWGMPAGGAEMLRPAPVAHEELARALDDIAGQLHGLGTRWREHLNRALARPLITFMLRNRDELSLTPGQVQTLEQLRADFQREAARREADLHVAETDLAALLNTESVDLGQVEAKLREIERLRTDFMLARVRTVEQGKSQLTPEQRVKLRSLLAQPRPLRPRTGSPGA